MNVLNLPGTNFFRQNIKHAHYTRGFLHLRGKWEKETDRQTDRQTETERDRDREETDTERGQQTNRDREGHRVRERESNFVMDGKSD